MPSLGRDIYRHRFIDFTQQLTHEAKASITHILKMKKWNLRDSFKSLALGSTKGSDSRGSCPRLPDFLVGQKGRLVTSTFLKTKDALSQRQYDH